MSDFLQGAVGSLSPLLSWSFVGPVLGLVLFVVVVRIAAAIRKGVRGQ